MSVHPIVSPRYYGYYLDGFREAFGWRIKVTKANLPSLTDPKAGLATVLPSGHRVFIAADDFAHVDPQIVDWADVIGRVNVDPREAPSPQIVPIGPSFGTPWSSAPELVSFVLRAGLMTEPARIPAMLRDYLKHQRDREPLSSYMPSLGEAKGIFFAASLWKNADEANERRLRFLRAARRAPEVDLEGGFWGGRHLPPQFREFVAPRRLSHSEYLDGVRRSLFVFNTPAVHDCLGWKLGEFLALGKAILSTPLGRTMPGEFNAGEHFHPVDDDEDALVDAIGRLARDSAYRRSLERNARSYWEAYLAPAQVARRVVAAALDA